jgi:hypothetical protein
LYVLLSVFTTDAAPAGFACIFWYYSAVRGH